MSNQNAKERTHNFALRSPIKSTTSPPFLSPPLSFPPLSPFPFPWPTARRYPVHQTKLIFEFCLFFLQSVNNVQRGLVVFRRSWSFHCSRPHHELRLPSKTHPTNSFFFNLSSNSDFFGAVVGTAQRGRHSLLSWFVFFFFNRICALSCVSIPVISPAMRLLMYALLFAILAGFTLKFLQFTHDPCFELLAYCVCVARGRHTFTSASLLTLLPRCLFVCLPPSLLLSSGPSIPPDTNSLFVRLGDCL